MYSLQQIIFILILLQNSILQLSSTQVGTLSVDFGRISNIADSNIHVAAALTLADCIRECVDFMKTYDMYVSQDCFAYNYDFDRYSCELIHSIQPMNYTVSIETRWQTGLKY